MLHQKVASEDDREVLLISKKLNDKFTTFENMLQRQYGRKLSQPSKSQPEDANSQIELDLKLNDFKNLSDDNIMCLETNNQTEKELENYIA